MKKTALVITSIAEPTLPALTECARGSGENGLSFIVIGDRKSPDSFSLEGCDFWSLDRQFKMSFSLAPLLPRDHYARKNLGYLQSIAQGCDVLVETDDDNLPLEKFWTKRRLEHRVPLIENGGWLNVYRAFDPDQPVWPRGLPLSHLHSPDEPTSRGVETDCICPIQQGLAESNPDVDAIYRLNHPLPVQFRASDPVALGPGTWCPFNSQNTTWFRDAFPLLYLPSHCSFRVTDIWRSLVAQLIAHANEWPILFHGPTVLHERNEHDLTRDFFDEIPSYKFNHLIVERLSSLDLPAGTDRIAENLKLCYEGLVALGALPKDELDLLEAWIRDLRGLGLKI